MDALNKFRFYEILEGIHDEEVHTNYVFLNNSNLLVSSNNKNLRQLNISSNSLKSWKTRHQAI